MPVNPDSLSHPRRRHRRDSAVIELTQLAAGAVSEGAHHPKRRHSHLTPPPATGGLQTAATSALEALAAPFSPSPRLRAAITGTPLADVRSAAPHAPSTSRANPATLENLIDAVKNPLPSDYYLDTQTGHPERRSASAPALEQLYRGLTGTSPEQSPGANLGAMAEFLGTQAVAGGVGKAAEVALAARGARDYGKFTASLDAATGAAPTASRLERLVGAGSKAATARAATAAAVARRIRQAEHAAAEAGKSASVAARTGREIKFAAKGRYTSAERNLRRATRAERSVGLVNPAVAAGAVTNTGQALIQGTAQALNPADGSLLDTLKTTGRVIPASLAYPVTAAGDILKTGLYGAQDVAAAVQGQPAPYSGSEVLGPVKGAAQEGVSAVTALAPLFSGDSAKVRDVIQNQVGLFALPIAPRALSGARAEALGARLSEAIPKGTPPGRVTDVGSLRRARQVIEGKNVRKTISEDFASFTGVGKRASARVEREIEAETRQIPGTPNLRDVRAHHKTEKASARAGEAGRTIDDPANLIGPLARFGISRKNPLNQLRFVVSKLAERGGMRDALPGTFTMRDALRYAESHPEVLTNEHLWNAVDIYKRRAAEHTTSERASHLGQGYVFGVPFPEQVTPIEARQFTTAKLKKGAEADLAQTRKEILAKRAEAKTLETTASAVGEGTRRELNVRRVADSRRLEVRSKNAKVRQLEKRIKSWKFKAANTKSPALRTRANAHVADLERQLKFTRARISLMASPARLGAVKRAVDARQMKVKAKTLRAEAKVAEARANKLARALDPYIRSTTDPSIRVKREKWQAQTVTEFTSAVDKIAAQHPLGAFEAPAVVAERNPYHLEAEAINTGQVKVGSRAPHVSNFKTGAADIADRSIRTLIGDSEYRPRMQAAIHKFVSTTIAKFHETFVVNGKSKIEVTGDEAAGLIADRKVDPREIVFVPSTNYKRAIQADNFDPSVLHADLMARLNGEIHVNEGKKGSKYVGLRREAAMELAAQLDPRGGVEKGTFTGGLSTIAMPMTRLILMQPAWAISQVVAEGLQAGVAKSPLKLRQALKELDAQRERNPTGWEAVADIAGESTMASRTPHSTRAQMDGSTQRSMSDAGRALRQTQVGRAMYAVGTGQIFSIFDRWKSGKYRQAILAAEIHSGFNKFVEGVQGITQEADKIALELAKQGDYQAQLDFAAAHPEMFDKHRAYLNDVHGNWDSYTRFERQVAPYLIFYPYLRMGLRWSFWSYPKHHPIKAQILYMLAQRNASEIEKLTGGAANFASYAVPVLHGPDAQVDQVLPAGQRFGAPGLNTIVEAVGTGNVAGFARALNPALAVGVSAATGVNPLSGLQVLKPTDPIGLRAVSALNMLLSMAAPLRTFGLQVGKGELTGAGVKSAELDPNRALRSGLVPFLPQQAAAYAESQVLGKAYRDAGLAPRSEASQFLAAPEVKAYIDSGDAGALQSALDTVQTSQQAKDFIKAELAGKTPAEAEARIQIALKAYYAIIAGKTPQIPDVAASSGFQYGGGAPAPTAPAAPTPTTPAPSGFSYGGGAANTAPPGIYEEMLRKSAAGR